MANIIDELITKYTLDAGGYDAGAKRVAQVTLFAAEAFDHARERAVELGKTLSEKLRVGEILAPLAALGTITGLLDFGKDAMEVAGKFDTLERTLAGVTGSYARARSIMEFGEHEASRTGLFKPEQLDQAAEELAVFHLSAKQFLPVVEELGSVFARGGEGLDVFAEAIGRIANGDSSRAMMVLKRSGITTHDLQKHGVRFKDPEGHEVASPAPQVIHAIQEVVHEKFGGVLEDMMNSPQAKAMRFQVAWEGVMRKVGQGIQGAFLPALDAVGEGITKIVEDGQIDRIVSKFTGLFSIDGGSLKTAVENVANMIEGLPDKIRSALSSLHELYDWAAPKLLVLGRIIAALWVVDKVSEFGKVAVAVWKAITVWAGMAAVEEETADIASGIGAPQALAAIAAGAAAYEALSYMVDKATDAFKGLFDAKSAADQMFKGAPDTRHEQYTLRSHIRDLEERIESNQRELHGMEAHPRSYQDQARTDLKDSLTHDKWDLDASRTALKGLQVSTKQAQVKASLAASIPGVDDTEPGLPSSAQATQTNYLAQIAQNTAEAVKDFRRYALGGGDLLRTGVTPVEMRRLSGGKSGLAGELHRVLTEIINEQQGQHMQGVMRQGWVLTN